MLTMTKMCLVSAQLPNRQKTSNVKAAFKPRPLRTLVEAGSTQRISNVFLTKAFKRGCEVEIEKLEI